jgi:citrate synthase
MTGERLLTTDEVARRLGVKRATVYAYVSRGLLGSRRNADGKESLFAEPEVEAFAATRRRTGPGPETPATRTGITLIAAGELFYRGHDVPALARTQPFESVATLLWTGELGNVALTPDPVLRRLGEAVTAPLPPAARLTDRLRLIVAAAAAADPLRFDTSPPAVITTARTMLATMVAALPLRTPDNPSAPTPPPAPGVSEVPSRSAAKHAGVSVIRPSTGGPTASPHPGVSAVHRPADEPIAAPDAGVSAVFPPAGVSAVRPSARGTAAGSPAGVSAVPPSAGGSAVPPSAGGSTSDSPAGVSAVSPLVGAFPSAGPSMVFPLAEALWRRLTAAAPSAVGVATLNAALVLLADHDLAASTLAARVAASTRAHPYAVVGAGLAALDGPLHGAASGLAYRMLSDAVHSGDPVATVSDRLRAGAAAPGFGHHLYPDGDPRARALLEMQRLRPGPGMPSTRGGQSSAETAVADLASAMTQRSGIAPNVDFALAAFALLNGMDADAGEAIFAIARTAGWIAHALEEYSDRPSRFRPNGRYAGRLPGAD